MTLAVKLLAVARHDHVAGLVDEAHGEQRAGVDGAVGVLVRFAHLVHLVGKAPARRHVGKHHVAVEGEERIGELIAFARLARNVEFHHMKPSSQTCTAKRGWRTLLSPACRPGVLHEHDVWTREQTLQELR